MDTDLLNLDPDRNPDPGFQGKTGYGSGVLMAKTGKNTAYFHIFFDQKLQFTYPQDTIKDVQVIGEAFSPQKRTFST